MGTTTSTTTRTRRELPLVSPSPNAPAAQDASCCAPLPASGLAVLSVDDATVLAARFAALADPVRLRLLSLLAASPGGEVCACDLVEPVGKSQPTVSHHLKILREAGLINGTRRGVNIWYAVVPDALDALRTSLAAPAPSPA